MKAEALEVAACARATTPTRSGPDRCPTTTELHRAADGLIARLRVPGGRVAPSQARVIADAAAGDSIELTSRANLQLRGLTDAAAAAAVTVFAEAGLTPSPAHDRARTIVASPLRGPVVDDVIRALDVAICAIDATRAVSGRVLTVVDDGSGHALADDADVWIVVDPVSGDARVAVGGLDAGRSPRAQVPEAAAALLGALATACTSVGVWRARELPAAALTDLARSAGGTGAPVAAPAQPHALPVGIVDGAACGDAVRALAPLGRLTATQLRSAADLAERTGADLRFDERRGLTLAGLPAATQATITSRIDPRSILASLTSLGFVTDPADPGVGLTACAGAACTRTDVDVRAAARLRLAERRPGSGREHLVGCERRCGAPRSGIVAVAEPGDRPEHLAARAAAATQTFPTGPEAAR